MLRRQRLRSRWQVPPVFRLVQDCYFIVGCDIRTTRGYVVAPPSLHPSSDQYKWLNTLDECPQAMAPDWLINLFKVSEQKSQQGEKTSSYKVGTSSPSKPTPYAQAALEGECEKLRTAQEGTRNNTLNNDALKLGTLIAGGELDQAMVDQSQMRAGQPMLPMRWTEYARLIRCAQKASGIS